MDEMELLEAIFKALRKDNDFPDFGSTLDHSDRTLGITIHRFKQHFLITVEEEKD